ncbi:MAG: bifunctional oligoribonuclease/PAP phosphatase NrnA [Halobacteriaceae archaeon]
MSVAGDARRAAEAVVDRAVAAVRAEPAILVAVAVAVLAAIAAAALWWRYWRAPGRRLQRTLGEHERVDVLMHPDPDPDAMACALGVAAVADAVDTGSRLCYPGEIRHQENRAFRTVLDLDCEAIASARELREPVVLVDHNEPRGLADGETVEPLAVVDHHPGDGTGTGFTDVRTEYGACATIVAEYLDTLGAEPGEAGGDGPELDAELATGLLYGILADTNRLTRGCTDAEFEASAYLYPGIDEDLLDRVANPQVDTEVLEVRARAIQARDVRAPYAVSDVGTVSNTDAIPQAADELLQLEGVSAVVVFGDGDDGIHLSGRSYDDRVHMGEALGRAVDGVPGATAGGHARMGGGRIPPEASGPGGHLARAELRDRLFEVMTGER